MDFEERVELELSVVEENQLLLKYGPSAKARSYAATHYGYISKGGSKSLCQPSDPGTILLDMSRDWCNISQNERVTLERDHYYIKMHEFQFRGTPQIEFIVHLPGIEMNFSECDEMIIKILKSFDYHEWLAAVRSIQQASLSNSRSEMKVDNAMSEYKKAMKEPVEKRLWALQEEQALPGKKVRPTRETRPEQPAPPKKGVHHSFKARRAKVSRRRKKGFFTSALGNDFLVKNGRQENYILQSYLACDES